MFMNKKNEGKKSHDTDPLSDHLNKLDFPEA
jgi:hypothetical protein